MGEQEGDLRFAREEIGTLENLLVELRSSLTARKQEVEQEQGRAKVSETAMRRAQQEKQKLVKENSCLVAQLARFKEGKRQGLEEGEQEDKVIQLRIDTPLKVANLKPATPAKTKPNTPAKTKPVKTKPATPANTKPATPAKTKSATPAKTKSATPAKTKPATPANTRPVTPAKTKLVTPAKTKCAVQAKVTIPAKETNFAALAPSRSPPLSRRTPLLL